VMAVVVDWGSCQPAGACMIQALAGQAPPPQLSCITGVYSTPSKGRVLRADLGIPLQSLNAVRPDRSGHRRRREWTRHFQVIKGAALAMSRKKLVARRVLSVSFGSGGCHKLDGAP